MESKDYYFLLRKFFNRSGQEDVFQTTIQEVSEVLHCTDRNVRYVLRKMEEEGLIHWFPGKGRGRHSTLTFRTTLEKILFEKAAQSPTVEDVSLLFKEVSPGNEKGLLKKWIENQFGFQTHSEQDTLRFPFYRPLPLLDPATVHRRTESHIINQICDPLVRYNSKTKKIEPHLAHYWEGDESHTRWTFFLRKGVFFHHGKQMTADDVVFTLKRVQKMNPFHKLAQTIDTLRVIQTLAIEIILKEPNALLPDFLSSVTFSIVPSDLDERTFPRNPIGTGPFLLEKNDQYRLVLLAHDHYFKERAHLDRIEIWVWEDKTWQDWLNEMDHDLFLVGHSNLDVDRPTQLLNQVEKGASYITLNLNKKGPLLDPRLREAIHIGLDPFQMMEDLNDHRILPASSFDPARRKQAYLKRFNQKKAINLVKASTYQREPLTLYTYISERNTKDSQWIQKKLADIGIHIEVAELPIVELIKDEAIQKADLILSGEVLNDPMDTQLMELFESTNYFIRGHLNRELKEILSKKIKQCYCEHEAAKRLSIIYQIEKDLLDHHALIFLYHSAQMVNFDLSLKGISLNALGNVEFNQIWVRDK